MNSPADAGAYEIVAPHAAALVESLRAFGYTHQGAIADLIDNSISAGARNVWLDFAWDGPASSIAIRDDGSGMTSAQLVSAMRPGSRSPLDKRADDDLGRFGLGLKTASFSQCRRLTVTSKTQKDGGVTRRWDLDYIGRTSEWRLLAGPAPGSESRLALMDEQDCGTQVLWECLDRIVDGSPTDDLRSHRRFLDLVAQVEAHVAMTFHRFLSDRKGISIHVNGRTVEAWDPFLEGSAATWQLGEERLHLHGAAITIRPYILPHHTKIDADTHTRAGGVGGWNAQQGFYVYRNRRLLVAGDWLGLGFQKEEHYKLARIAVDLPNSLDHDWDIDVRKSRARPPGTLRDDLKRIARVARERAAGVYRHRGKTLSRATGNHVFLWKQQVSHGRIAYRINYEHPAVAEVLAFPQPYRGSVQTLIRLIEETVPVPLIVVDAAERPDSHAQPLDQAPTAEILQMMGQIYASLRKRGMMHPEAVQRLLTIEPFHHFPHLAEQVATTQDGYEEEEPT